MTIRLYDTATRTKVALRTPTPGDPLTMYVCGPTVYGRAHIGNARPAVVFDTLARLIRRIHGPDALRYAANITDIDDKIMAKADAEGVGWAQVAARYETAYRDDMAALGVAAPDVAPRATDHVPDMLALIARLVAAGVAYAAEGHVLFSVQADPAYGSLSGRDREAMVAGARVEVAPYKRDAADFVLWKPSAPEQPGWDSAYGRGRPGWHLECSAMIERHLGETIDIHGGGLDLVFPHHENEAAQSRCVHGGAPLARVWMHNGMLNMADAKMSKSVGNIVSPHELLEGGWDGETLRAALLSAHYRQPQEWTVDLILETRARLDRLHRAAGDAEPSEPAPAVLEALADDLNTPTALAALEGLLDDPAALRASAQLMGLLDRPAGQWFKAGRSTSAVTDRIEARLAARRARDFATADRIRAELLAEGIALEDRPDGTTDWRRA